MSKQISFILDFSHNYESQFILACIESVRQSPESVRQSPGVMGHASNNMGCLSKSLHGILSTITHRPMRGTGRLASCDVTCSRVYLHLLSQLSA